MAISTDGVRAGFIAGLVYGILDAVIAIILVLSFREEVIASLNVYLTQYHALFGDRSAVDLFNLSVSLIPMISVSGGVALGTFLGALFAGSYEKLPGRGARAKGISLGLILWLILSVLLGLLNIGPFGIYYYLSGAAGGLVATVVYGYLLGTLYIYFGRMKDRGAH